MWSLGRIAAAQHGLITLGQALEAGATRRADSSTARGPTSGGGCGTGVFALAGAPRTWEQRGARRRACRSGPVRWRQPLRARRRCTTFPTRCARAIEVTVPPGTQPRVHGLRVHRPGLLPDHDVDVVDGIPVTSYARTLVDCTGRMSLGQIARALDAGLVRHEVTLWSVERSLSALGQAPGRHPSKLWTLLGRAGSRDRSRRRADRRSGCFRVLDASGLPTPTQQHWVQFGSDRFRLDLAYPGREAGDRVRRLGHAPDADARSTRTVAATASSSSTAGSSCASRPRLRTPRSSKPSVRSSDSPRSVA